MKNISKEIFQNQLIKQQGENVTPQIIHEKITKKNLLDNALRPSNNEICNTIRREGNDTEVFNTTKRMYVEGKVNGRIVRFLVDPQRM